MSDILLLNVGIADSQGNPPMKRLAVISTVVVLLILIGLIGVVSFNSFDANKEKKPFYVGVTFCGNTTQDAKLLIERVENYTNLFVLQSGSLMANETAVKEIGDYAIANGLRFAAYFDTSSPVQMASWIGIAEQRWGNMFAGVYYGDEPGGKMLDTYVNLSISPAGNSNSTNGGNGANFIAIKPITKLANGGIQIGNTIYFTNGTIRVITGSGSLPDPSFWHNPDNPSDYVNPEVFDSNQTSIIITYFPNGSITIEESVILATYFSNGTVTIRDRIDNLYTVENGTKRISQVESYAGVLNKNPISNCNAAAEIFTNKNQEILNDLSNEWQLGNRSFPIFTSDYALYWWDYESGYDLVLAQLGWNNTVAQEIGLIRGAASLRNRNWGVIITWTYTEWPYLTGGSQIFDQMRLAYESGAEYVVIFNYAEDMEGPLGILQEEHFDALKRFWNEVVQNPAVVHGGTKAEAAFVLPENCGWGLRNPSDIVWGLWEPTTEVRQAWSLLQSALAKHNLRLDIVYDDPAYPIAGRYRSVYYWNQTG
ncbi:TPA: hypothetical protein HA273_02540 [Candidatus Bathyarchaeota archaeon]|nr:hypothetical protein [Candidatus Bathyarchaeota archaeon]HIJ08020.1 hypothetical protein [Candidatus Bathyarchaeota archaeon]